MGAEGRRSLILRCALLAALGFAVPLAPHDAGLAAQVATRIEGQVRGFDTQPLAEATLIFHHLALNQQQRLPTDSQGRFSGALPPGRYRVAILHQGKVLWVVALEVAEAAEPLRLEIDLEALRRRAEAPPVLDVELQRRLRQHEEDLARRMRVRDHYRQGLEALERGDTEAAIRELESARDLEPSEALYQAQLGEAYAGAGRLSEAVAAYEAALRLEPDDPALRNNYANVLARAGRTEEALAAFSEAARHAGEQAATVYFNWGATLFRANRYAEAADYFRRATQGEKADAMAFYFLGLSLDRSVADEPPAGRHAPEAREAFARYLALAPDGKYAAQAADHLKRLPGPSPR